MDLTLEEFLLKYKDYAKVIASKFIGDVKEYGIDFEDLYQTGCLALVECYHRYDKMKASYSTFAYQNVYYAILSYINNNCYLTHVSGDANYLARYLRKKQMMFYLVNGRDMTLDESIEALKKCLYSHNIVINERFVLSLNKANQYQLRKHFYYGSDGAESYDLYEGKQGEVISFEELIISSDIVEEEAINNVIISEVRSHLEEFTEKSKNIFIDVSGLDDGICKSCRKVSEKYDISHQSVSNNYRKVLKKLKTKF